MTITLLDIYRIKKLDDIEDISNYSENQEMSKKKLTPNSLIHFDKKVETPFNSLSKEAKEVIRVILKSPFEFLEFIGDTNPFETKTRKEKGKKLIPKILNWVGVSDKNKKERIKKELSEFVNQDKFLLDDDLRQIYLS